MNKTDLSELICATFTLRTKLNNVQNVTASAIKKSKNIEDTLADKLTSVSQIQNILSTFLENTGSIKSDLNENIDEWYPIERELYKENIQFLNADISDCQHHYETLKIILDDIIKFYTLFKNDNIGNEMFMFKILVNRIKQTNERITRLKTHHQTTIDLLKKQPTSIKSEEKEPIFIKQLERIHKINAEWNATKQETEEMSEIKQKLEQFDKQNKEIEDMKKKMVELEKQTQSIDGMKNQILELEKFVQTSKNISVSQKSDKSDVKLIPSSTDKPQTSRPQKQQITSASPKLEDKPAEELLTKFSHNVNNLSMSLAPQK